jgi:hypothetical protein
MPTGQSSSTTTGIIDQSSQLSLPPPPAPIPTAFEHYAPEEQRDNTASLLALLMGGHGTTPTPSTSTASGPPNYHHPTPSPHQIPVQVPQVPPPPQPLVPPVLSQDVNLSTSLAPLPSLSNQVSSYEHHHHQQQRSPRPSPSPSVYTAAPPNHIPSNNPPPPRNDASTTDHALTRLFARFAPSQSQPLFVQTVVHAINVSQSYYVLICYSILFY